jgi:hypothetical protein
MERRPWTDEEQQKLFDDYFGPVAGICPVCAHEVNMLMSYLGSTITLLFTCDNCGNKASVNRVLPTQGPLRTSPIPTYPSPGH